MEVYKILMIIISAVFIFFAAKKIREGMSLEEYAFEEEYLWFCAKVLFVIFTVVILLEPLFASVNWKGFFEYKITL
jgi:hypothetical protein